MQTASGQCTPGVSYWDLGIRGDTGPSNHSSGFSFSPTYSVLDDPADYSTGHNLGSNPSLVSQYCNGSRVPPTCTVADGCGGPSGYGVPPGIADALSPNPVFSLTPAATVDEGNNWINVSWGPLSVTDDSTLGADGNYGGGALFGNYALAPGSPAIDYIPVAQTHPTTDFFGNSRPDPVNTTKFDVGAIEYQGTALGPIITTQPTNQTVVLGAKATFTVVATGTPTLTYQWQLLSGATWVNFGSGTGTTSATMTTNNATAGANGLQFRVVVTDGNGLTAISNTVTLTVSNAAPVITVQPTNQTVLLGAKATFSVTATGNLPLTYQWQLLSGATWVNFGSGTGTTSATMTTNNATAGANGLQLRVVVTDGNALTTTSNTVTLTVSNAAPVITVKPTSQTVTHPAPATFSVTATGNLPLTYQWQFRTSPTSAWVNFVSGSGATSATMTTNATSTGASGLQFQVVVTDGNALSTTSNTVTLTVH